MSNKKIRTILIISIVIILITIVTVILLCLFLKKKKFNFELLNAVILVDGAASDEDGFIIEFGSDRRNLDVVINDNSVDFSKYNYPDIKWSIVGESYGCKVKDNWFDISECNVLANVCLRVEVKSKNIITADAFISIVPKSNSVLKSLKVEFKSENSFSEGYNIDNRDFNAYADFGDYDAQVLNFVCDRKILSVLDSDIQIMYEYGAVQKTVILPVNVVPKKLQFLRIINQPSKVEYIEGECFEREGLIIEAVYEYLSEEINGLDYYIIGEGKPLTTADKEITIMYIQNADTEEVVKTVSQTISVRHRKLLNLSVNTENAKLYYIQGENFDAKGLEVKAIYDVGEETVTSYYVDTVTKLVAGTAQWQLFYSENDVELKYTIPIVVDKPYNLIRRLIIDDSPAEINLNWMYSYTNDNGEDKIDNTLADENELMYNSQIGIYEIPVGAMVVLEAVGPAIIDFCIDGVEQGMEYPERTLGFEMHNGVSDLHISYKKISGRRTVIFKSDVNSMGFSYSVASENIEYKINSNDLKKLSVVFDELNEAYINVYTINGEEFSFQDLSEIRFLGDNVVQVQKRERNSNYSTVTLVYWDDIEVLISIDATQDGWELLLPVPERVGYEFCGWVRNVSDEKFYAQWERNSIEYVGEFIGLWYAACDVNIDNVDNVSNGTIVAECVMQLRPNGTYEYKSFLEGEVCLNLNGFYSCENGKLEILTINSLNGDVIVAGGDFDLNFENVLSGNLLIQDGYNIYKYYLNFNLIDQANLN